MLRCSKCAELKSKNEFYKNSLIKNRKYNWYCKICLEKSKKNYQHTIDGIISLIYDSQKRSAQKRQHHLPFYTKTELLLHAKKDKQFIALFKAWKDSNYEHSLKPSYDRLDNNKSYVFSNIEAVTWQENMDRYHKNKHSLNRRGYVVPVAAINDKGEIVEKFTSLTKAAMHVEIKNIGDISASITRNGTAGGYKWKYL